VQIKSPLQVLLKTFASMPEEILEGVMFYRGLCCYSLIHYVTSSTSGTVSGWWRCFLVYCERR